MLEQNQMPSAGLPDYLKTALRVGEADAHPLISALEETVRGIAGAAFLRPFDLNGATACLDLRRRELGALGFHVQTLSAQEQDRCFARREFFLSRRGTLGGIAELAEIYFEGCEVRVGQPYETSRLGKRDTVRLADLKSHRHTVFVRLPRIYDEDRCREFLHNAQRLVPHPFQVQIAMPRTRPAPAPRWCLGAARSWEKRRVSCLISLK